MGSEDRLAREVRAPSRAQLSRGLVRPAQTGSSPSRHLTPAWRGAGVCRAREDGKSSRSVVRGEGKRPGSTHERQWTRRQGTVVAAPLGTGRAAVWLRLATTRHFSRLVKQQTLLQPQAPHTRQEFTHSLTPRVMSEIDIFVSSTGIITLDHMKNNTFVGNTGHFDNENDSSEFLDGLEGGNITPLALQMRRLHAVFALFSVFFQVRSLGASAEMTRQVESSTLGSHQMALAGVVAHSSSWTPAACELEESSPPSNLYIGGLSELLDG